MKKSVFYILGVFSVFYYFSCNNFTKQKYFSDVEIDCFNNIIGVNEIISDEVLKNTDYYKFTYNSSKLQTVEYFTGDILAEESFFGDDVAKLEISYGDNSEMWVYKNLKNQNVRNSDLVYFQKFKLNKKKFKISKINLNIDKEAMADKSKVIVYNFKLDNLGRCVKKIFSDKNGKNRPNSECIYSIEYRYNANNKKILESYLNKYDKLIENKEGVAQKKFKYNEKNLKQEVSYFNKNGMAAIGESDCHKKKFIYDNNNRLIEIRLFNKSNKLKNGAAITKIKRDRYGNNIEESYYDNKKKTCLHVEKGDDLISYTSSWHKIKLNYNRGKMIEVSYYDTLNKPKPVYNPDLFFNIISSFSKKKISYDKKGRVVKFEYFDRNGFLTPDEYGVPITKFEYDDKKNITTKIFCDINENVMEQPFNIGYIEYHDDINNNLIKIKFYDKERKLIKKEVAIRSFQYNKEGYEIQIAYYDNNNKLKTHNTYAKRKNYYDSYNNIIKVAYFDESDKLKSNFLENNICYNVYKYDNCNRIISTAYYDSSFTPRLHILYNYFKTKHVYNINRINNYVEYTTFTNYLKSKKYRSSCEYLLFLKSSDPTKEYNDFVNSFVNLKKEFGYINVLQYYGVNEKLINNRLGYSSIYYCYNKENELIATFYFDNQRQFVRGEKVIAGTNIGF